MIQVHYQSLDNVSVDQSWFFLGIHVLLVIENLFLLFFLLRISFKCPSFQFCQYNSMNKPGLAVRSFDTSVFRSSLD